MKVFGLITVFICGAMLVYATTDFPDCGDPATPACRHVSAYYIEHAETETAVPNIVTAVLADYRGYDTMFETAVIFSAAVACFLLLRIARPDIPKSRLYRHAPTGIVLRIEKGGRLPRNLHNFKRIDATWVPDDLIVKTACRLFAPFIQLFALYVIAHGHHSPGGGFQGGVILGASIILFAVSNDLRSTIRRMSERLAAFFCSAGVFIYAATGAACLFLGGNFLDYSALAVLLGGDPVTARSHGILIVEIGVGMAVMAVMVCLYYILSSAGKLDEGL